MATRVTDEFGVRANAPDAAYPDGSLKNESAPLANDGSPLDERVGNDWEGTKQYLLQRTNTTPNGQPDSVTNPQIGKAIEQIAQEQAHAGDSNLLGGNVHPIDATVSANVGDTGLVNVSFLNDASSLNRYFTSEIVSGEITALSFPATPLDVGTATVGGTDIKLYSPQLIEWQQSKDLRGFGVKGDYYISTPTALAQGVAKGVGSDISEVVNSAHTDNTAILQELMSLGGIYTIPDKFHAATNPLTMPKSFSGFMGTGKNSGLVGLNSSEPVLLTFDGTSNTLTEDIVLKDFNISGVGECGVAIAQTTTPNVHNLTLQKFTGRWGFVFEHTFGGTVTALKTNGAVISDIPYCVFRVVLDIHFDMLYSSNVGIQHNVFLDQGVRKYSINTNTGNGVLRFTGTALQGASSYGFCNKNYQLVTCDDWYVENVGATLFVGIGANNFTANNCVISKGTSGHGAWLGGVSPESTALSGVGFNNCRYDTSFPVIVSKYTAGITVNGFLVVSSGDIKKCFKRTSETPSSMPFSLSGSDSSGSIDIRKTTTFGWKMLELRYNTVATPIVATEFTFDEVATSRLPIYEVL